MDIVRNEAEAYDVLVFSESWLKPGIHNDTIQIENFMPPFRADRVGRLGGGVVIYDKDPFYCKRRTDIEILGVEAVWVELKVKSKTVLIGGFYRAPNSKRGLFHSY